jgi:hypothetical protein
MNRKNEKKNQDFSKNFEKAILGIFKRGKKLKRKNEKIGRSGCPFRIQNSLRGQIRSEFRKGRREKNKRIRRLMRTMPQQAP